MVSLKVTAQIGNTIQYEMHKILKRTNLESIYNKKELLWVLFSEQNFFKNYLQMYIYNYYYYLLYKENCNNNNNYHLLND